MAALLAGKNKEGSERVFTKIDHPVRFEHIKAPNSYSGVPRPWVFLAGSIEMGTAEEWQETLAQMLLPYATILNPRRADWDNSWDSSLSDPRFVEQVEWELRAQEDADRVLIHFDPRTKSPITLLELGLFWRKAIVHCPEGYWKKGNVDILCRHYGIPQVPDLISLAQSVIHKGGRTWTQSRHS